MRRGTALTTAGLVLLGLIGVPNAVQRLTQRPVTPAVQRLALEPVHPSSVKSASGSTSARHPDRSVSDQLSHDGAQLDHDDKHLDHAQSSTTLRLVARVSRTHTDTFGLAAVTWQGNAHRARVELRIREPEGWQPWQSVGVRVDAPDVGSVDQQMTRGRWGTDPVITSGRSTGIQARVWTASGRRPRSLDVVLIDGRANAADAQAVGAGRTWPNAAFAAAATPTVVSRAGWGADESLRTGDPRYASTIKMAFVHHTVTSSTYSRAQGPAQVRAVYAYDTLGLGISDLGYNFMVDRYGTVYEGRAGGVERAVVGAHTAGFNKESFAVAVLGDLQNVRPGTTELARVVNAVGTVAGWKLGLFHRDPMEPVSLISDGKYGTSKYNTGEVAKMPYSLVGHGDIGLTACPGKYLRTQLGLIRDVARKYQGSMIWNPAATATSWSWQPAPASAQSGTSITATVSEAMKLTLRVTSACAAAPVRTLGPVSVDAGAVDVAWDGFDDAGQPVPPGHYTVEISAVTDSGAVPLPATVEVDIDSVVGAPRGPCEQVWRAGASGSVAEAVLEGNAALAATTTAVIAGSDSADLADAVVAAVLARRLKAVFALVPPSGVSSRVIDHLKTRGITRAVIVAREGRLPGLPGALSAAGVGTVTSVAGQSSQLLSIAAMRRGWTSSTTAVVVPASASAGVLATAAAYAAARRWPLLIAPASAAKPTTSPSPNITTSSGTVSPSESTSASATASAPASSTASATGSASSSNSVNVATAWPALADVKMHGTLLVGTDATANPIASWGWPSLTRIKGRTSATVALGTAKKFGTPTRVMVTTDGSAAKGYAILAALESRPTLVISSSVTAGVSSWLATTTSVEQVTLLGPRTAVSPVVVPDFIAALSRSSEPSPTGSQSPSETATNSGSATAVPSAFVFRGAGFGHGIGMPQYGAQAQALSGRTAREIIEYYYTGAKVKALDDSADIRVNVLHQKPSITFRVRGVDSSPDRPSNDPPAAADITTTTSFRSGVGDTFTAAVTSSSAGPRMRLQRTDAQGRTTTLGNFQRVVIRWGGTRDPGLAGSAPAYIDIAGPDEGLGDGYGRYRYGSMTLAAVAYSESGKSKVGLEAVSQVRVHDEYLRGIGEVPASWSPAALQAQVIASRGYALSALRGGVRSGCDCHLYDSDQSQIFAGWVREVGYTSANGLLPAATTSATGSGSGTATASTSASATASSTTSASSSASASASATTTGSPTPSPTKELPLPANSMGKRWAQAVLATSPTLTKGLTATVDGKAIASYFYSASAGRTENSEEIWTARLSWARSVADPWSIDADVVPERIRDWQVTLSQQQVADFFRLKNVVSVSVVDRTSGGAVTTLKAVAASGSSATASAVTLRKQYGLKSRWISAVTPFGKSAPTTTGSPTASPIPTGSASNTASSSPTASSSSTSGVIVSPALTITSVSAARVRVGESVTVKGRVTGRGARGTVSLWQKRAATWVRVTSSGSVNGGWWRLKVAPPIGTHTFQVRGNGALASATRSSRRFTVIVTAAQPVINVSAPATVTSTAVFTISGRVTTAATAIAVQRQRYDEGRWQARGGATKLARDGRWSQQVTATVTTQVLRYRMVVLNAAGTVLATSREFSVRVKQGR